MNPFFAARGGPTATKGALKEVSKGASTILALPNGRVDAFGKRVTVHALRGLQALEENGALLGGEYITMKRASAVRNMVWDGGIKGFILE